MYHYNVKKCYNYVVNDLNKYINKLENHKLEDHQKKELRLLLRDFTIRLIQLV